MSVAVKRLEGVESVELSLQRAVADIRLRDGNRISLDQIRQIVKDAGFTPKEAVIEAVGRPIDRRGATAFQISGIDSVLLLATGRTEPAILKDATSAAASAPTTTYAIAGTIELKSDGTNEVVISRFAVKR